MNGLSAIAEILAVFCPGSSPGTRAEAEKVAASTPKYTSLMGDALSLSRRTSMVRPRAGRNGILRAPSMRARLATLFSGAARARSLVPQDPYEHHAGPGRHPP